jgi:hypothetical protein
MRTEVFKMDITTYLIHVYCLIENWLKGKRIRQRGPQPRLSDSEVLTIEVVGEFLGIDTDQWLYTFFRTFFGDWFPELCRVDRTTFARQAANLWVIKEQLFVHLSQIVAHDPLISVVDSFPMPVCRFARANRCRLFAGLAAFGYDEVAKQTYYGLRAHVRICWPGVIVAATVAPANVHDTQAAEELLLGVQGWALGDRNYWKPDWQLALKEQWLAVLAPFKSPSVRSSAIPTGWWRSAIGLKRCLGSWSNGFMRKKSGRGMPGISLQDGGESC